MPIKIRGLYRQTKTQIFYYGKMRNGVRKPISLETKDENEAIQRVMKLIGSPELGLIGSWEDEVESFIKYKVSRDEFSRFSAENKRLTVIRYCKMLKKPLTQIRREDIQRIYDIEQKRHLKKSTIQGYMMCLRSFFSYLKVERKVIRENPAEIDFGKWEYGEKDRYCIPEERDILLKGWKDVPITVLPKESSKMIGFIFHSGFEAGFRRNEIIEGKPEWFFIENNSIHVCQTDTFRPKDRENRHIPLTRGFKDFLKNYPMTGTWCIAPDVTRGRSRYRYDFIRPFNIYLEYMSKEHKHDFTWITPHHMRHTFASLLAIAGESIYKIAEWMGISYKVAIAHYAHLQKGDKSINKLHSSSLYSSHKPSSLSPRSRSVKSTSSSR